MKKNCAGAVLVILTGCYFGANESGGRIIDNFHLIGWDERDWQIVYSEDNKIYHPEKIIIGHDVFAVGNNDDFIIVKQHPCDNPVPHLADFDTLRPDKEVTNYYIIDIRHGSQSYKLHKFADQEEFDEERRKLGVPMELTYKFYDAKLD